MGSQFATVYHKSCYRSHIIIQHLYYRIPQCFFVQKVTLCSIAPSVNNFLLMNHIHHRCDSYKKTLNNYFKFIRLKYGVNLFSNVYCNNVFGSMLNVSTQCSFNYSFNKSVSSCISSSTHDGIELKKQDPLLHILDFEKATKNIYAKTRRASLLKQFMLFFDSINLENDPITNPYKIFKHILKQEPSIMYTSEGELNKCLSVLWQCGIRWQQLVSVAPMLVQPSSVLREHKQLLLDMGIQCQHAMGLIRMTALMEIPEYQLVQLGILSRDSSVLERLLLQLGPEHVADREALMAQKNSSQKQPLKWTYNRVLAAFLAHRFNTSVSSCTELLQHYQHGYRPLSIFYLVCDIIENKLGFDFQKVCSKPALLDVSPPDTLALFRGRAEAGVGGLTVKEAVIAAPALGRVPRALLEGWLQLLDAYDVKQFPLQPVVVWTLQQDLLVMAQLVLEFLQHHPCWQIIKSSAYLFEIIANPDMMNELMGCTAKSTMKGSEQKATLVGDTMANCQAAPHLENVKQARCKKKHMPSAEVVSYLLAQLGVDRTQVALLCRSGRRQSSLQQVTRAMMSLTEHGFSKDQIIAGIEIFSYDADDVKRLLSQLPLMYSQYDTYWLKHPNVVNLLLYHLRRGGGLEHSLQQQELQNETEDTDK